MDIDFIIDHVIQNILKFAGLSTEQPDLAYQDISPSSNASYGRARYAQIYEDGYRDVGTVVVAPLCVRDLGDIYERVRYDG